MFRLTLVAALLAVAPAQAHSAFGPWSPATELTAVNSPALDGCPFPSRDGLKLYFASTREPRVGGIDIWVSERASTDAPWGPPVNLGAPINSPDNDFCPSPGPGGSFMFVSTRPGCGAGDIYLVRRPGEAPVNLGCEINSPFDEAGPVRSHGQLYFSSTRTGNSDIYASRIRGRQIDAPAPVAELNTPANESRPYVRRGREIVFDSDRPGSQGPDIWTATRRHAHGTWSVPVNLGPSVNSAAAETRASLSGDGRVLYFGSTRGASQDIFTSTRGSG